MDGLGVAMDDVGVCIVGFTGGGLGTGGAWLEARLPSWHFSFQLHTFPFELLWRNMKDILSQNR